MISLGINAAFHDSAACLVKDGEILAAAEEERFSRIKHGKRPIPFSAYELPFQAIHYCLKEAGVGLKDVDRIGYSYDPALRLGGRFPREMTLPIEPSAAPANGGSPWDPLFLSYVVNAPRHLIGGVPHHLRGRFRGVTLQTLPEWRFYSHHLAHAASAYYPSPYDSAAVLVMDGRGETDTTTHWRAADGRLELLERVQHPHSLGLLYEKVTSYLGFLHSSDEYKVMALASYGKPRHRDAFLRRIQVDGGTYRTEPMDLEALFGPPRERGGPLLERHIDVASSLQASLEETALKLCAWLHRRTGEHRLCLAGGVALNCVMNARIRDEGPFSRVWVQPAAGDDGTALGCALLSDARSNGRRLRHPVLSDVYLGPEFSDGEIEDFLRWSGVPYRRLGGVPRETARLLADGRIVGWFQGRMEFGPRALGARSILASPIPEDMQQRLNRIKEREDFRPVAPVVLEEREADWFDPPGRSPYMLFIQRVRPEKRARVPAICHTDGSARIQTISRDSNPRYYDVVLEFERLTGVPVLVNTSFNSRGEPIVCSPKDALEAFISTPIDALVIGSFLVLKEREKE